MSTVAVRNALARKAMAGWRLPISGLGAWGRKCCEQWHLMRANDAVNELHILGGLDFSRKLPFIRIDLTINRPVEPDAVRAVWMDEKAAFCEYMAGTGGKRE